METEDPVVYLSAFVKSKMTKIDLFYEFHSQCKYSNKVCQEKQQISQVFKTRIIFKLVYNFDKNESWFGTVLFAESNT